MLYCRWPFKRWAGLPDLLPARRFDEALMLSAFHPEAIEKCLARGEIAVVAGFQGISEMDEITTLGAGGADSTAVALTAAIAAERCDVYTDIRGVFTADPRIVSDARCLPALSYEEMIELTTSGADLLSASSLELALDGHPCHSQIDLA